MGLFNYVIELLDTPSHLNGIKKILHEGDMAHRELHVFYAALTDFLNVAEHLQHEFWQELLVWRSSLVISGSFLLFSLCGMRLPWWICDNFAIVFLSIFHLQSPLQMYLIGPPAFVVMTFIETRSSIATFVRDRERSLSTFNAISKSLIQESNKLCKHFDRILHESVPGRAALSEYWIARVCTEQQCNLRQCTKLFRSVERCGADISTWMLSVSWSVSSLSFVLLWGLGVVAQMWHSRSALGWISGYFVTWVSLSQFFHWRFVLYLEANKRAEEKFTSSDSTNPKESQKRSEMKEKQ